MTQACVLQACVSKVAPEQVTPPQEGAGLSQAREWVCVPPPQAALQLVHPPHEPQPPLTGEQVHAGLLQAWDSVATPVQSAPPQAGAVQVAEDGGQRHGDSPSSRARPVRPA